MDKKMWLYFWLLLIFFIIAVTFFVQAESEDKLPSRKRVLIGEGSFTPLYGLDKKNTSAQINSFYIDAFPVTNKEFFEFTKRYPKWKAKNRTSLTADEEYLKNWSSSNPSKKKYHTPVTHVSWFAAQAYCKAYSGRLPTVLEWEYVAAASATKKDASRDKDFLKKLLKWYSKPHDPENFSQIGMSQPNYWKVYDMHGLIWEWNYDYNSVFVTGDSRQDQDALRNLFCGSGAVGTSDPTNYAAFMRYALRNSLKAHYTIGNLGFRCMYPVLKGEVK